MSSFSRSFLIEERETLLGDVSIEVVNEESSVDSRNLHCRTSSSDSTSVTASERKVRALRERSPTMILCRNFSLIMKMRALIDGHWRAMRATLLAVYLWRQRIRLANSARKDSSLASNPLSRIHDSARRGGMAGRSVQLSSWRREG